MSESTTRFVIDGKTVLPESIPQVYRLLDVKVAFNKTSRFKHYLGLAARGADGTCRGHGETTAIGLREKTVCWRKPFASTARWRPFYCSAGTLEGATITLACQRKNSLPSQWASRRRWALST